MHSMRIDHLRLHRERIFLHLGSIPTQPILMTAIFS